MTSKPEHPLYAIVKLPPNEEEEEGKTVVDDEKGGRGEGRGRR